MGGPSKATLAQYGLEEAAWWAMYHGQGGRCAICRAKTKRLCVDHEHVKGWKKMPPEKRRQWVRGLLCWRCNVSIVGRGVTREKLSSALRYLELFSSSSGK